MFTPCEEAVASVTGRPMLGGGSRAGQGKGVIAVGRARPLDEHTPSLLKKELGTILAGAALTFISPLTGTEPCT